MTQLNEKFDVLAKLGEGTYGIVWKVRDARGQIFAVKEIKQDDSEEGVQSSAIREIAILLELQHPNVVKLYEVLNDKRVRKIFLVFEYLDLDLHRLMSSNPYRFRNNPALLKYYMWQLLSGLDYCHSRKILHRDLKPQNLLINKQSNQIKLGDFGLARAMGLPIKCLSPEVVTIWYRAPELLLGARHYTWAVDTWSLGCIFAEMVEAKPLFPGTREIDQLHKIVQVLGVPDENNWPGVSQLQEYKALKHMSHCQAKDIAEVVPSMEPAGLDLLRQMLVLNPQDRISPRAALRHAYFSDIDAILAKPPQLL